MANGERTTTTKKTCKDEDEKQRLTCIFVNGIGTLNVSCDRLDTRLFGAHFLEERMVGLQVQHARTLAIVQRFCCAAIVDGGRRCATFNVIRCGRIDVMMKIRSRYNCVRIVIAADNVRLFCGTVFRLGRDDEFELIIYLPF